MTNHSERTRFIKERRQDLGRLRLADMDAAGIDRQIISLTCPGVQAFDTDRAIGIATLANDQLAEACRRHPERFAGLTAVAPQDPGRAAKASRACNWSSGTSARRCRSGCTGWTTCTVPPCVPNATSASNRCSAKSVTT